MFSLCRDIMLLGEAAYVQTSETRLTEKCQDVNSVTPAVPNQLSIAGDQYLRTSTQV